MQGDQLLFNKLSSQHLLSSSPQGSSFLISCNVETVGSWVALFTAHLPRASLSMGVTAGLRPTRSCMDLQVKHICWALLLTCSTVQ